MFIALFTIAKGGSYLSTSTDVLINNVYKCNEIFSAFERKQILTQATTWTNFEDIMLTEISQSQKDKLCIIPLTWGI